MGNVNEDDEDEETLQLQLQEIQARLKLKKLQKAKLKDTAPSELVRDLTQSGATLLSRASSAAASRSRQEIRGLQRPISDDLEPCGRIHVPVSPTRRVQAIEQPKSPGRILLGIDKGLKGSDVSLRRAPSLRNLSGDTAADGRRAGNILRRAGSQASSYGSVVSRSKTTLDNAKPRTFSERMADVRTQETDRLEKDARIKRLRSKAFDIGENEMNSFKTTAVAMPEIQMHAPEFSRDEILHAYNKPATGLLQRSKSTSALSSGPTNSQEAKSTSPTGSTAAKSRPSRKENPTFADGEQIPPSEFESFSSLHLSKRIIPHNVLTRTLAGKKTFTIPDLLKVVVAPHFKLPDVEEDIVLLGIIASKSEPRQHKAKATKSERGKYMVMSLTDLKWELELYLFNSGFDKFWKLTPGTIIAILNPDILPPIHADTGRFSVTLNSDETTILELGTARDLGFCKTVKKDGKTCDSWVDKRHTEYCEFHINEQLKKTKAGRMEVNTMNNGKRLFGVKDYGSRKYNSRDVTGWEKPKLEKTKSDKYDRELHSRLYIAAPARSNTTFIGGPGGSAANLLDEVDVDPDAFHRGMSKEERLRRQLAATEKEKNIARRLAKVGGGIGADYMRMQDRSNHVSSDTIDEPTAPPPDANALGLLGTKGRELHLSPIKRKRPGTNTPTASTAMGWGSDLTKELGRMKDGERLQPVKKKTRFVTAKGIREAGRESFGPDMAIQAPAVDNNDDDDDDDLDIIR